MTLNVGSPAADVVYDDVSQIDGSTLVFYAESPQGDLLGRPSIRVSHETKNSGIVRSLVDIQTPVYDADKEVYDGFIKTSITLNRKGSVSISAVETELEKASEALTLIRSQVAKVQI
jgi:hypothetical protein